MFTAALILFGLWNGVLGSETACQVLAEKDCPYHTIPPKILPGNDEELEAECQNLYKLKQCIKDSVKKCMEEGSDDLTVDKGALERLRENKRMIDLTSEICQKDSYLHTLFVKDMACFREVTAAENKEGSCTNYSESVRAHLQSHIDLKLKQFQEVVVKNSIYKCLEVLADMNCYLIKFHDRCGYRAKYIALQIIEKGSSLDVQCPVAIRIDVLELVEAWKSIAKKGMFVRELIPSDI